MSALLETPHLPTGTVDAVAIGEDCVPLLAPSLAARGVRVLSCPANPDVDPRLRSHIDLSVLHLGGPRFVLAAYLRGSTFAAELTSLGAEPVFAEDPVGAQCPADARLCALQIGDRLFHRHGVTDAAVLRADGFRFVPVRQAYAKCAVCPVSRDAAITADPGMASALRGEGIEVFSPAPTGVSLSGYETGFFGGASFLLSPDTLALTGRPELVPNWQQVQTSLASRGISVSVLSDLPIYDIGSCILLTERKNYF